MLSVGPEWIIEIPAEVEPSASVARMWTLVRALAADGWVR
jgi:hypothetical protein